MAEREPETVTRGLDEGNAIDVAHACGVEGEDHDVGYDRKLVPCEGVGEEKERILELL